MRLRQEAALPRAQADAKALRSRVRNAPHNPRRLALWPGLSALRLISEGAAKAGCRFRRGRAAGNSASPAIWVAAGGRRGHTGIRCFLLTVGVFGVTNSTCDDSSQLHCDRNAAVGKMSLQGEMSVEHPGL